MIETKNLKSLARETADLALALAALPAEGLRDAQALSDLELLATRILKEASKARAAGNVRSVGESSGMWRVMQPFRP